jgi:hypothetical protein
MSPPPSGTPWTEQQRGWLQALGHDVLMFAPGAVATMPADPAPSTSAVRAAGRPDSGLRSQPATAKSAAADSPLLHALARAAGRQAQDAEFLLVLPDLSTLRGNAAARRQLWPRLRALRKADR